MTRILRPSQGECMGKKTKAFKIKMVFINLMCLAYLGCDYVDLNQAVVAPDKEQQTEVSCSPPNSDVEISQITFAQIKSEVLDPHCLRCHNPSRPSAGIDLSNYASVKARIKQIDFAISRNIMPPSGPLDGTKKGLVADWIKAGSIDQVNTNCSEVIVPPSNPAAPGPNTPKPPGSSETENPPSSNIVSMPLDSELNFTFIQNNILELRCVSCHSDIGGNRGGINLERYSEVVDELKDILEEINKQSMPPPPRPALSLLEKNIIARWAKLGAPK